LDPAIDILDWKRMLLGDEPPLFLLEIAFRTSVIYIYTLVLLRWLGSRTIGQLSTIEFLLVIALGSAVGDAMFYPDVPLIHALLVITIVVLANKGLDFIVDRSQTAERIIDGSPREAIRDGTIDRGFINESTLSRSELFQQLREHGVEHLGQVAAAYLETDGRVTVFRAREAKPGLPIVPPWEIADPAAVEPSAGEPAACRNCGDVGNDGAKRCGHCGHDVFVKPRF
jgi:uncharacterized membrane protein YcaP (DUF421 family)/DNA-directed RNA polymerase subunit RPC12/RpoP